MRGDIVDLQVSLLSQADHSVQALTQGLIEAHARNIKIADWSALRAAGGFNEAYLHLSRGGRSPVI
jgi:hypothetical protein